MKNCQLLHINTNKIYSINREVPKTSKEYSDFQIMSQTELDNSNEYTYVKDFESIIVNNPIIEKCFIEMEEIKGIPTFYMNTSKGRFEINSSAIKKS